MTPSSDAIDQARRMLTEDTSRPPSALGALGASAFAAAAAVLMAGAVILGPGVDLAEPAVTQATTLATGG